MQKSNEKTPGTNKTNDDGRFDQIVGVLTHATIARVLTATESEIGGDLPMFALARTREIVRNSRTGGIPRNARLILRVATSTGAYLNRFMPGSEWSFLGGEVPVPGGRVDLAWQHSDGRVLFDELKTTKQNAPIGIQDQAQIRHYAMAGQEMFGSKFVGIRYIPLMYPGAALFGKLEASLTDFTLSPLAQSGFHPLSLQGAQS